MIRRAALALAIAGGGCAVERAGGPDAAAPAQVDAAAAVVAQPSGCAQTFTLIGAVTPAPVKVGPIAIDATGFNVCVTLDATALQRAHVMGGTSYETGTASSFAITLEDASRAKIVDGWDVTVDDKPPRSFTNLEWSPPAGQVTTVVIWVRARGATATTTFDVALFDPLE